MSKIYPALKFNQFDSGTSADELLLFSAKAKDIFSWAGIPRKGWQIRMLFQRPITSTRENELKQFWSRASNPVSPGDYILGPTAIIVAIQDGATAADGSIDLSYDPPVDITGEPTEVLQKLSALLLPRVTTRLSAEQQSILSERVMTPFSGFPMVDNDYVFEFALQLQQISNDAARFLEENTVSPESANEMIQSMEAILRPAIVVDGQHRLYGAANIEGDVHLPVVAIPHCPWTEQIYQFVVINEKAQRVDPSLLTDIFGSSLTSTEQVAIRRKLARSSVEIQSRIAAVIAGRESGSPFENMVVVKMDGRKPGDINPYVSERTIRVLIEGASSQKFSLGWRTDENFYNLYVKPTLQDRSDWDSWEHGKWMQYWFAFWDEVKKFYNERGMREKNKVLWDPTEQSNLTKAITLRQLQSLFMVFCSETMRSIEKSREVLLEVLGDHEIVDQKLSEQRKLKSLPENVANFRDFVRTEFLERGVPVKVFTANWKTSLDDSSGQEELWQTLELAFRKGRQGESIMVKGRIFEASEQ